MVESENPFDGVEELFLSIRSHDCINDWMVYT